MPPKQTKTDPRTSPKAYLSGGPSGAGRGVSRRPVFTSTLFVGGACFVLAGFASLGVLLWATAAGTLTLAVDPFAVAIAFHCVAGAMVAGWSLILAAGACQRAGEGDWRRVGTFAAFTLGLWGLILLSILVMSKW